MKQATRTALVVGLAAAATAALAGPSMMLAFNRAYRNRIPRNSALDKGSCTICHVGNGPKLNLYGDDVKQALAASKSKSLTVDVLKSIEPRDSDRDGATNADEVSRGTLPGDPKSVPARK